MKIDKKNYKHWFYLLRSAGFILLALPFRYMLRPQKNRVILYGHKLNGNLKAFYDFMVDGAKEDYELSFLTLDPQYYKTQKQMIGKRVLHLGKFRDVIRVARSGVIITDHGTHTLNIFHRTTKIPFVDVWHGIPFKGFTADNFAFFRRYEEIWTTSEAVKSIYVSKFGLDASRVHVTGYGRVDRLVTGRYDKNTILETHSIDKKFKKIILIAPTWKQDDLGRSILPFKLTAEQFFGRINKVARANDALVIFRAHLNSKDRINTDQLANVEFMPYQDYPVAEEFLFIADMLITDWSSIAFDYLPLERPTIFLDVSAPFKNGFTIGPEHRFGEVASSIKQLEKLIDTYMKKPDSFKQKFKKQIAATKEIIYGDTLDGKSSKRYYKRLQKLLPR